MTDLNNYRVTDYITQVLAAQYNRVIDCALRGELANIETLAANKTLVDADFSLQVYSPSAARNVTLPAVAATNHPYIIVNASATYTLTVKNAGGTTIGYVDTNSSAMFASDGTAWYALDPRSGLRETAGPTFLAPGAIPDAHVISRSGNNLVGMLSMDGWIDDSNTWTYTGTYTFTVPGDQTATFKKGMRIRFTQSALQYYGIVLSSAYGAPNTTVTLVSNTDYGMINAAITAPGYSYLDSPNGWPDWFSYTPVWTASGSMLFGSVTNQYIKFRITGKTVHFAIRGSGTTSGTASTTVIATLPVTPRSLTGPEVACSAGLLDTAAAAARGNINTSTGKVEISRADLANFGLGALRVVYAAGFYEW